MIEGLNLEVWGQRARRVKAVLVTEENRNAILLWLDFTQDEIDAQLGGIVATLEVGDAIVLTDGGTVTDEEGNTSPKPGTFTRVAAASVDYLYRRNVGGVSQAEWWAHLDECEGGDDRGVPAIPEAEPEA